MTPYGSWFIICLSWSSLQICGVSGQDWTSTDGVALLSYPGAGFLSGRRRELAAAAGKADDAVVAGAAAVAGAYLPTPEQRPMLNTAVRNRVDVFGRAAGDAEASACRCTFPAAGRNPVCSRACRAP